MRSKNLFLATVFVFLGLNLSASADTLYLKAGRMIDGLSDRAIDNPVVRIEDGRIAEVGRNNSLAIPGGVDVIDLGNRTILPGLMDAHVHLTSNHDDKGYRGLIVSLPRAAINGVANARKTLMAGFTTVRNVGADGFSDIALRDAINDGDVPGPRLLVSGPTICGTGGHCDNNFLPKEYNAQADGVANGPWAMRAKVRENIKYGADLIKITATGGVFSKGTTVGGRHFTMEELIAVVEEAHLRDLKVAAHAHGTEGIKYAIRAGVDSVEHASMLDGEAIQLAKDHGTFLSMDIYNTEYTLAEGEKTGALPENIEKERQVGTVQRESFRRAVEAGVKVVLGSDAAIYPHGDNGKQLSRMVRFGMTPMQAVKAATSLNAELFGRAQDVGAIEAGRYADIIAVDGDPLDDISILETVPFVMKGGVVYKNE